MHQRNFIPYLGIVSWDNLEILKILYSKCKKKEGFGVKMSLFCSNPLKFYSKLSKICVPKMGRWPSWPKARPC